MGQIRSILPFLGRNRNMEAISPLYLVGVSQCHQSVAKLSMDPRLLSVQSGYFHLFSQYVDILLAPMDP